MKSSVDGIAVRSLLADASLGSQGGDRAKQPYAEFDDEHAKSGTLRRAGPTPRELAQTGNFIPLTTLTAGLPASQHS
jgi:hypothetical protein